MGINEIRAGALALSEDERAQLAGELLDSLHPGGMEPDELAETLSRRNASLERGSAVLHDINVATETLERMLAEHRR